jgi:hypothetical protein
MVHKIKFGDWGQIYNRRGDAIGRRRLILGTEEYEEEYWGSPSEEW